MFTPTPRRVPRYLRDVRRVDAVVVLMTLGLLARCSNGPESTAVVHGQLMLEGGAGIFPAAGVVRVVQGPNVVATAKVAMNGRFSVAVVPGNYQLEGTPSRLSPNLQCYPHHIRAAADQTLSANVYCGSPTAQ